MRGRTLIAAAITGLLAVGLSACGGSSSSSSSSGGGSSTTSSGGVQSIPLKPGENPAGQPLTGGKKGGTLTELSNGDFEHLDPGSAYYSLDYQIVQATERPLFSYPPNSPNDDSRRPRHRDPDRCQRRDHRRRQDGDRAHHPGGSLQRLRSTAR